MSNKLAGGGDEVARMSRNRDWTALEGGIAGENQELRQSRRRREPITPAPVPGVGIEVEESGVAGIRRSGWVGCGR